MPSRSVAEELWAAVRAEVAAERLDPALNVGHVRELAGAAVAHYGREAAVGAAAPLADPAAMVERLVRLVCAYGPLTEPLASPATEEVLVEDDRVWVIAEGRVRGLVEPTSTAINRHVVDKLLSDTKVALDEGSPLVQAQVLAGRARLTAASPPVIDEGGISASLRLYRRRRLTLADLVEWGTLTPGAADFLALVMRARGSVIVSGDPAAGKTTLFAALLAAIPENHCVRVCEDYPELPTPQLGRCYHTRPADADGHGAVTLRDLVRFVLGMRADFIAVGEVRGAESWDLGRAMHAGTGFGCTVHAHSAEDALEALVLTALGAGPNLNEHHVRKQFATGVDVVVHIERDDPNQVREGDPYRRQVTEIRAVVPDLEPGERFSTEVVFERAGGLGSPLALAGPPPTALAERLGRLLPAGRRLHDVLAGRVGLS